MKIQTFVPTLTMILMLVSSAGAWPINPEEVKDQNKSFTKWWDSELIWRFDDLPSDGSVLKFRYPYAGAIYPDNVGGTANVLRKYDRAFHRGRSLAESYEHHDIRIHQEQTTVNRGGGLFGFLSFPQTQMMTPYWAGHCNGWAAAAIRHAEPVKNVTRNGVVFTPADIKGLLAELYVYSSIEHLGGVDRAINPGTFHVVLANWLGRNEYPIAWDSTVGKEIWNYPVYAYRSSHAKRGSRQVEVKINVGYVNYTQREHNVGPENYRHTYFHYTLDLDQDGKITGGNYHRDSNRVDMLWAPLRPTAGGQEGNESGNPHLDVDQVLSLWRESAPDQLRQKWFTIDPPDLDRVNLPAPPEMVADSADEETGESVAAQGTSDVQADPVESERDAEPANNAGPGTSAGE